MSMNYREPDWVQAGYGVDSYQAKCVHCGEVAELDFGCHDNKRPLTPKADISGDEQDVLFVRMFFCTVAMLWDKCCCDRKV